MERAPLPFVKKPVRDTVQARLTAADSSLGRQEKFCTLAKASLTEIEKLIKGMGLLSTIWLLLLNLVGISGPGGALGRLLTYSGREAALMLYNRALDSQVGSGAWFEVMTRGNTWSPES